MIGDIPPHSIGVREHWYRGEPGSLKTGNRKRDIPICGVLDDLFLANRTAREVYQSTRRVLLRP
jgi:hypothetical protein